MNQLFQRRRLARSAGVLTAAIVIAGPAALVTTGIASAAQQTHTLHLTVQQIADMQIGKQGDVGADRVRRNGVTVGFDTSDCVFNFAAGKAVCDVALSLQRGMLQARVTVDQNNSGSGKVVGGTRGFRGATGTVTTAPGTRPGRLLVTITYTT
jgi:hypothetical protein